MQALAGVADELGEPRFDVEVHVLELQAPDKAPAFDLRADLLHALLDGLQVGLAQHADAREHRGMRARGLDVGRRQAPVKADAGRVAQHEVGHGLGKTP